MSGTLVAPYPFAAHHYQRPPPFVCACEDGYVYVAGEIDIATAPQLEHALAVGLSRASAVVLDLQDVTFLDSEGTRAIVMASVLADATGRRLVLLHGPPDVDRLFALTGNADQVVFFEPPIHSAAA